MKIRNITILITALAGIAHGQNWTSLNLTTDVNGAAFGSLGNTTQSFDISAAAGKALQLDVTFSGQYATGYPSALSWGGILNHVNSGETSIMTFQLSDPTDILFSQYGGNGLFGDETTTLDVWGAGSIADATQTHLGRDILAYTHTDSTPVGTAASYHQLTFRGSEDGWVGTVSGDGDRWEAPLTNPASFRYSYTNENFAPDGSSGVSTEAFRLYVDQASAVPEPGSAFLMGISALGFLLRRRR